jgi:putative transposase
MRYAFIDEDRSGYGRTQPPAVARYCHALKVSESGYYRYLDRRRHPARRTIENQRLLTEIVAIYEAHEGRYGTPRVTAELRKRGRRANRKRVARLMRAFGLRARSRKRIRITTRPDHRHTPSPNRLEQRFTVMEPKRVWLSDTTYIRTTEGWTFLTVVMDLASRKIVGSAMSDSLEQEGTGRAIVAAFEAERPARGLLFHSDRGAQYTSQATRTLLERYGAIQSMSGAGNCYDNAPMESFFKTLKHELVDWNRYPTRGDAARSIDQFIHYYNDRRLHSALGYRTPREWIVMQHHSH